jgi:hypothetical protein
MQFDHLAEMEAHDGQRDSQREQARTPEQGPEKEPPVLDAFDAADAQLVNGLDFLDLRLLTPLCPIFSPCVGTC